MAAADQQLEWQPEPPESLGMFEARHLSNTIRKRGFMFGSPPPIFAAMVISLLSFEKIFPRLASIAPLKRLTLAHLLCPAMMLAFWLKRSYARACSTCTAVP